MDVFVTGGSGYIGQAVVACLHRHGHTTLSLARSSPSVEKLRELGSEPIFGDLADSSSWSSVLCGVQGVIHLADTFGDDAGEKDTAFVEGVVQHARSRPGDLRLVYTGGVWLFGDTKDQVITESLNWSPPPAYAYTKTNYETLLGCTGLRTMVIHPAMVWDEEGGVIQGFLDQARQGKPPIVTGTPTTRWPMIHRDDVAELYRLALERGVSGVQYNGVSERAVPIFQLAKGIANSFRAPSPVLRTAEEAANELGSWAQFLAYDQVMESENAAGVGWIAKRKSIMETWLGD